MSTTTNIPSPTTPQKQENPTLSPNAPQRQATSSEPEASAASETQSGEKVFPFHSLTTKAVVRKVEDVVHIQGVNGQIETISKDQFESQFAEVKEDVVLRDLNSQKLVEGHKTDKGTIVHGSTGVEHFESDEQLEGRYAKV